MKMVKITKIVFALGFLAATSSVACAETSDPNPERTLETLRNKMTAASASMLVSGVDFQIRFPYAPLMTALTNMNNRPEAERTIVLQSIALNGDLWSDGPTWCNSSLYLARAEGLRGRAILSNLSAKAQQSGNLNLGVHVDLKAQVDAHWHFKGKSYDHNIAGIKIRVCPPGGGFGGDIGGHGETSFDGAANLRLSQVATSGELAWELTLTSPPAVNMTLSIGFQHIGDLGIPQSFKVPLDQVARGQFQLLLVQNGTFSLPGSKERTYKIVLTPAEFQISSWGVTAGWKSQVVF